MSDFASFFGDLTPVVHDGPPDPTHIPETVTIVGQIDDQLLGNIYQSLKYEGHRELSSEKIEGDHWKEGLNVLIVTEPHLLYERVKVGYIQGDFFLYVFSEDFNFMKGYAVEKKTRQVFSWDLTSDE